MRIGLWITVAGIVVAVAVGFAVFRWVRKMQGDELPGLYIFVMAFVVAMLLVLAFYAASQIADSGWQKTLL